jgi:hopanoid biosynthesis associated protein HpnK
MVGAPAAADAVALAHRLPNLRVGLHLVLVSGTPVLPAAEVPALVDAEGKFSEHLVRAGFRFAFDPAARRALAREIRAQFEAFRATGLPLDHANAHRHMHLHPAIGRLLVAIGREYGLKAVRVPMEPPSLLRRAGASAGACAIAALHAPPAVRLRARLRAAGIASNDRLLGLAWTGGMTEARVLRLLAELPEGVNELYLHPTTAGDAELAALVSPAVRRLVQSDGIALTSYGAFT